MQHGDEIQVSDGMADLGLAFVSALALFAELAIFSILYLREGKPSKARQPTDAELRRRGWIMIAAFVTVIATLIGLYFLFAHGAPP